MPALLIESPDHVAHPESCVQSGARKTRLYHAEKNTSDSVQISDQDVPVDESLGRQIFSEQSRSPILPIKNRFPVTVMVEIVRIHRFVRSTVMVSVGLRVPFNTEEGNPATMINGDLED